MLSKRLQYILIIIGAVVLASCGNASQGGRPAPGPIAVTAVKVQPQSKQFFNEYPAVVKALQEVDLRSQVSGYITGIHFTEGSEVKKGQKLYSIDQQQTQAAYQQALANLSVQQANLERAKKDVERYRELDEKDAIAKQQVDYAEATYAAAVKQVDAAKAAVSSSQTNVRYSTIVAPFDGTIGISQVRLGAAVTPGQTLLNTISSNDPMAVEFVLDQSEIMDFASKLKNKDEKADSAFHLAIGGTKYPYPGKLTLIDRAVDQQTGTIKARVEFSNAEGALRPGMSVTLQVSNEISSALAVPFKALTEQLGEFFVYTVKDDNTVSQQKVIRGRQIGTDVILESGVSAGQTVVVEGVQKLREGAQVTIQ